jgi:biotin-dependent carboxylase-like uncharacterized protein
MRALEVLRAGLRTTVQDAGRIGLAHLGIPRSGAADLGALHLANRLVGNQANHAGLEVTLSGCAIRPTRAVTIAVTGAACTVRIDGRAADWGLPLAVPAGAVVEIGPAYRALRSYVAVSGGIAVRPVLGSRATDTLSGLGPAPVTDSMVLPVGGHRGPPPGVDLAPYPPHPSRLTLRVWLGPRDDWFTDTAVTTFFDTEYAISPLTDRIAARLTGAALQRAADGEIASEGVVLGAVQVPADGLPLIFLVDHPTTGGYPVIGVVDPADLPAVAQARPGTPVRFAAVRQP